MKQPAAARCTRVLRARATPANITAVRGKRGAESIVSKVIYGRRSADQFAARCAGVARCLHAPISNPRRPPAPRVRE